MKVPPTLLLLLTMTSLSFAGELMESLKTREGREYFKVEVLTNDDVGIRIRHEAGTARVAYEDLPDAIQSKYRADWKKAAAARNEAAKAESERMKLEEEEKKQAVLAEKEKLVKPRPAPKPPKPVTDPIPSPATNKELAKLDAYIEDLRIRSREAVAEASRLRQRADAERSKVRSVNRNTYGYGETNRAKIVPDKSGWAQATKYEEEAFALERQADKARALIAEAKARREQILEGQGLPPHAE